MDVRSRMGASSQSVRERRRPRQPRGAAIVRSTTCIFLCQTGIACGGAHHHVQHQLDRVIPSGSLGTRCSVGHTRAPRQCSIARSNCDGSAEILAACFVSSPSVKNANVPRGTALLPPPGFKSASRGDASTTATRRRTAGSEAGVTVVRVARVDLSADPRPRGTRGDRDRRKLREEEGNGEAQQRHQPHVGGAACEDPMKVKLGRELEVCRVINGLCQGPLDDTSGDTTDALRSMDRLAETGLTSFMLGNGAGGGRALAERRAGSYLKSAAGAVSGDQEVRFLNTLSLKSGVPVTRRAVKADLELSLRRMGVERLDLVQLCWHNFEDRYFLDALYFLEESECVSNVGVCGFPTEPLALAAANGFTVVSNLVSSSLIKTPLGGTSTSGGGDSPEGATLARQCKEQGVALISSGASLGGFAADKWLLRSPLSPSGSVEGGLSLAARQALSDILAWGSVSSGSSGSSSSSSGKSNGVDGRDDGLRDPWRRYQSKLLPQLQAVARKHGRGLSPADVATAFHLYRKPIPSYLTGIPGSYSGVSRPGPEEPGTQGADARGRIGTASESSVAAVSIPVRVYSSGSLSARRSAEADEDRVAGRRGAELAEMLDLEDVERIAEAVSEGTTASRVRLERSALGWEQEEELSEEAGGREEWGEDGALRGVEVGWEGPTIFL